MGNINDYMKNIFPNLIWRESGAGRSSIQADFLDHYLIVAVEGYQGSGYTKVIWVQDKRINNEIVLEIIGDEAKELVKLAYSYHVSRKEKSREEFINLISTNENN